MDAPPKPDFKTGVPVAAVPDGGLLLGSVGGEDAVLIRRGTEWYAVGASCTHYHRTCRAGAGRGRHTASCPLHHACFSLRTGEALRPPAAGSDRLLEGRADRGDTVFVREKSSTAAPDTSKLDAAPLSAAPRRSPRALRKVVIVGGGAAGLSAADALRRRGYDGALTMISADDSPPCDRPNLSKDFLAGTAPPEWIPLRPAEFYAERNIELVLESRVSTLDIARRRVEIESGRQFEFDALLLATGAEPVRLDIPGAAADQVCYLRTFADSRAISSRSSRGRPQRSRRGRELHRPGSGCFCLRARSIDGDRIVRSAPKKVPDGAYSRRTGGTSSFKRCTKSHGVRFHLAKLRGAAWTAAGSPCATAPSSMRIFW